MSQKWKTIRRDVLMKMVEAEELEAKCDLHLTDDYKFDDAYGFGKTDWMPARLSRPEYEKLTLENGNVIDRCINDDWKEGYLNLHTHDFGHGVRCTQDLESGLITLREHSNLYYSLRKKLK